MADTTCSWRKGARFLLSGQHAQALTAAKRALQLAKERGEPPQQAHALKLLGEICAVSKQPDAANHLRAAKARRGLLDEAPGGALQSLPRQTRLHRDEVGSEPPLTYDCRSPQ
jgi:hypothetical protein